MNAYDKPQTCICPKGLRISHFKSHYNSNKHDRQWDLGCSIIPNDGKIFFDNLYQDYNVHPFPHNYDEPQSWDGEPSNHFLVGMTSVHSNYNEDRKFTLYYQQSNNWILTSCSDWKQIGSWKEAFDIYFGQT